MDSFFSCNVELSDKERQAYIDYVCKEHGVKENSIKSLIVTIDGDNANLDFTIKEPKFERIRRITGYLVGDLNRWNNAKRAEEHDRVKHF